MPWNYWSYRLALQRELLYFEKRASTFATDLPTSQLLHEASRAKQRGRIFKVAIPFTIRVLAALAMHLNRKNIIRRILKWKINTIWIPTVFYTQWDVWFADFYILLYLNQGIRCFSKKMCHCIGCRGIFMYTITWIAFTCFSDTQLIGIRKKEGMSDKYRQE